MRSTGTLQLEEPWHPEVGSGQLYNCSLWRIGGGPAQDWDLDLVGLSSV